MNIEDYRNYCLSLPLTEESLPFNDNALVFYIKGKMFSLTNNIETFDFINVKCDPEKAIALRELYEAVIPGYHMNKKHWNTIQMDGSIADITIKEWIRESYQLVVKNLPKKDREGLL
jgi:predicted DNA-binding protein (MmcQ/YjbR family)